MELNLNEISFESINDVPARGERIKKIIIYLNMRKTYTISSEYFDEFDINKIEKVLNELSVQKLVNQNDKI